MPSDRDNLRPGPTRRPSPDPPPPVAAGLETGGWGSDGSSSDKLVSTGSVGGARSQGDPVSTVNRLDVSEASHSHSPHSDGPDIHRLVKSKGLSLWDSIATVTRPQKHGYTRCHCLQTTSHGPTGHSLQPSGHSEEPDGYSSVYRPVRGLQPKHIRSFKSSLRDRCLRAAVAHAGGDSNW